MTDETRKPEVDEDKPGAAFKPPPLPDKPLAYLEVLFGQNRGKRIPLDRDRLVIGRGDEADLVLDDPSVSREHVAVEFGLRGYVAIDLGSANGTRFNGEKREELVVEDGFTIEAGATVLAVRFGDMPPAVPEVTLRNVDTQRLEAVSVDTPSAPATTHRPKPAKAANRPENTQVRKRRSRAPHPLVAQVVSWLVVLSIVTGGILLILNLLEGGALSHFKGSAKSAEVTEEQAPVRSGAGRRRRGQRPTVASQPTDFLMAQPGQATTADVAMESFDKATALWKETQYQQALELFAEINRKYPEFTPPSGTPVQEIMDELRKTINYSGIVAAARTALEAPAPDVAALEQSLDQLDSIPTTDGQFGEEAFLLRENVKSKLKQIELGFLEEKQETQSDALPAGEQAVEKKDPPDQPRKSRDRQEKKEESRKAAEPAKHKSEQETSTKDEKAQPQNDKPEKKPAKSAEAFLAEARSAMDAGRYSQARQALELAAKGGAPATEIKNLETVFSLKLSRLIKDAMDKSGQEPEMALVLVKQALSLAKSGSPQEKQALMLQEQLQSK